MVPPRGDMHGTETSADTQGHAGSPHPVHSPILGTHSGQTPFHSGHECTQSDKEISSLINSADVAWWVRDTNLGVTRGSHFTFLGLSFLICRM